MMKSLVLLASSVLLLVTLSNAQQNEINCNLQNGAGCYAAGPYFYLDYQFTHSGSSSQCRQAYNLIIRAGYNSKGVECNFVTDGSPQYSTYRYTISHNQYTYWDRSPSIRVYGHDALFTMNPQYSGIYYNNWWYVPQMHASYGYSWAYYKLEDQHLSYYSSNTGVQHQSGHPHSFTPRSKDVYVGLNKKYESSSQGGYGLCQVYCRIIPRYSFGGRGSPRGQGSPGSRGSNTLQGEDRAGAPPTGEVLTAPPAPSAPPPAPTGSGR